MSTEATNLSSGATDSAVGPDSSGSVEGVSQPMAESNVSNSRFDNQSTAGLSSPISPSLNSSSPGMATTNQGTPKSATQGFTEEYETDDDETPVPEGIHPDTLYVHGIDPDTHERVSVSMAGLKYEFGDRAPKLYKRIAQIGGFFNHGIESASGTIEYTPDLQLEGLEPSVRTRIEGILNQATEKKAEV